MAESYMVPGQSCDVGIIKSKFPALDDTRGWNAFCDCMFKKPVLRDRVYLDGALVAFPPGLASEKLRGEYVTYLASRAKAQNPARGVVTVKSEVVVEETEEWRKCVSNFCTLPWGCPHPTIPGFVMPLNVSPFAGSPPWTELGAAARGIRKRDAGFFYTVGQIITVDLKDYEPLTMWRNMFLNPALFNLHMAKLPLFAGPLGLALFTQLNSLAIFDPTLGAFLPKNIPLLIGPALAQAAIERRPVFDVIIKPAFTGAIKNSVMAFKIMGPALGGDYFAASGIIMARFAQDQIETGEINKVLDPFTNGFIRFLAAEGENLGRNLQAALGKGLKIESLGDVVSVLERGLKAVAESPQVPANAKIILNAAAKVLGVAGAAIRVFSDSSIPADAKAWKLVDDVCYQLFGFPLTQLKDAVAQGGDAVNRLLARARQLNKPSSLDAFMKEFEGLSVALTKVVEAINKVNEMIGGGLENFSAEMAKVKGALDSVGRETTTAFKTVTAPLTGGPVGVRPMPLPVVGVGPAMVLPARIPPVKPPSPPKPPAVKEQPTMSTLPLLGAAAGFAVGGPLGAAAGLAIGSALGPKSPQRSVSGFGAFGLETGMRARIDASAPTLSTANALPLAPVIVATPYGARAIDPNRLIAAYRPVPTSQILAKLPPAMPGIAVGTSGPVGTEPPPVVRPVNTAPPPLRKESLPRFDPSDPSAEGPPPGVAPPPEPAPLPVKLDPQVALSRDRAVNAGLGAGSLLFGIAAFLVYKNLK